MLYKVLEGKVVNNNSKVKKKEVWNISLEIHKINNLVTD